MPPGDAQVDALERFARLAFEFGPFFFALLFLFFATRMADRRYREARAQAQGPDDPDVGLHRRVYFGTVVGSWILVAVAVGIWLYGQFAETVARFSVVDVEEYDVLTSDSTYYRMLLKERESEGAPQLKKYDFAAVVRRFGDHGATVLTYWRGRLGKRLSCTVLHDPGNEPRFRLNVDPAGERYELVEVGGKDGGGLVRYPCEWRDSGPVNLAAYGRGRTPFTAPPTRGWPRAGAGTYLGPLGQPVAPHADAAPPAAGGSTETGAAGAPPIARGTDENTLLQTQIYQQWIQQQLQQMEEPLAKERRLPGYGETAPATE
jgi:hypothetical protein